MKKRKLKKVKFSVRAKPRAMIAWHATSQSYGSAGEYVITHAIIFQGINLTELFTLGCCPAVSEH